MSYQWFNNSQQCVVKPINDTWFAPFSWAASSKYDFVVRFQLLDCIIFFFVATVIAVVGGVVMVVVVEVLVVAMILLP